MQDAIKGANSGELRHGPYSFSNGAVYEYVFSSLICILSKIQ